MNLDAKIEAILYFKNEPVSVEKLALILKSTELDIRASLRVLAERLKTGGLVLISSNDEFSLGASPQLSDLIEEMIKDDLSKELGKSALDTLTIILYYGPVSKLKIDNIRGVNSGFVLRNLLIRGLIERIASDKDQRSYLYRPTLQLISYLGLGSVSELPEYEEIRRTIDKNLSDVSKNESISAEA